MNRKEHWNQVYGAKAPDDVSWYQTQPTTSLKLIEAAGIGNGDSVIDVGGGASSLVDFLLDAGFTKLAVLDISAAGLALAQQRLAARVDQVEWIEADATEFSAPHKFSLWHDRAVFHFLTAEDDRRKYIQNMTRALTPVGHVIIATFGIAGPLKCSGLDVVRYDAATISRELGPGFQLLRQVDETHVTPWDGEQKFSYFLFARKCAPQS